MWLGQSTTDVSTQTSRRAVQQEPAKANTSAGTRKKSFPPVPSTDKAYPHVHSEKKASRVVSIIAEQALKGECGAERLLMATWQPNPGAAQLPHPPLRAHETFT